MKTAFKWLGRLLGIVLLLATISIGWLIISSQPVDEHPFFANLPEDGFVILAHQGGDGEAPGNTIVAFQNAVDVGADVLELDIHSTADGEIVVIHDATIDRTTDGEGRVNDFTLAELQTFDAGYNYPTLAGHALEGTGEYPFRGQGITIPTLAEVFETFPDIPISVEIKQAEPPMEQATCDLIREYERENSVVVVSFSADVMTAFREACPEIATGGVAPEVTAYYAFNLLGLGAAWHPTTETFMVPEYQGDLHVVRPRFINGLGQHNVRIYPWTINDTEQMQRMFDWGVDGIITDYPTEALALAGR
ncbi:MAG: glycerophosphodiester phosphodiesterase [Chloroflexota bacterium]